MNIEILKFIFSAITLSTVSTAFLVLNNIMFDKKVLRRNSGQMVLEFFALPTIFLVIFSEKLLIKLKEVES